MNSLLVDIEENLDPFPLYETMRQSYPVYHDPERNSWHVFRYEDVKRVLSDFATFSSQFRGGERADPSSPFSASIISSDPPRHHQLRILVAQAFTVRAVEALAPRITEIVTQQLDRVMASGRMDVIQDLGYPLPVIVIAELLGIPSQDRQRFKHWSDYAVHATDSGTRIDFETFSGSEMMEMGQYFFNTIEKRRQEPGDDLISGLLQASIDGEHLNQMELLGFCVLLLVAGNETTTNLIGNAMRSFAEHPEVWEHLRAHPELLPLAIEEVLRYRSPVQAMFRTTTGEVKMDYQTIPARASVVAWIGSANRDPAQFAGAESLDIERSPNRHLGFGNGIHYCLGAPLARLEAKIALGSLLERVKGFRLAPDARLKRQSSLIVYGLSSLPITYA
jgi:cytochrome P450